MSPDLLIEVIGGQGKKGFDAFVKSLSQATDFKHRLSGPDISKVARQIVNNIVRQTDDVGRVKTAITTESLGGVSPFSVTAFNVIYSRDFSAKFTSQVLGNIKKMVKDAIAAKKKPPLNETIALERIVITFFDIPTRPFGGKPFVDLDQFLKTPLSSSPSSSPPKLISLLD